MYFTELMGLAFGIKPKELGLFKHLTEVDDFLRERALI
jgi:heterodisulfide reductase subunit B